MSQQGRQVSSRDFTGYVSKKGATVIIVTHNGALAPIADRVIRMHDAKVKSVEINELPQDIATLEY